MRRRSPGRPESRMSGAEPDRLFVYGTLRKGGERSAHLEPCALLGMMEVPGTLYLTPFGYPAAVFDSACRSTVRGELYVLPPDREAFLKAVDRVEGVDEKLFSRSAASFGGEFFYCYEPGAKLRELIGAADEIHGGDWFCGRGTEAADPFSFALRFENIQKRHYRMKPDSRGGRNVFLEGRAPVLVTCPHSTAHVRMGKLKRHEFYTAALGAMLNLALGCHCLYANREQETDPNYCDDCGFKARLGEILSRAEIDLVIDLHGTGNERAEDLFPGVGTDREFLLSSPEVLDGFYLAAREHGIPAGAADVFPASRQMTVAKFAARRFSVPAIQVEISDRLRTPSVCEEEFRRLLGFLSAFVERIIRQGRRARGPDKS